MGNKMCKKKVDHVDNPKSPSPFDKIITRLHLKPHSWKSDPHLHSKQVSRSESRSKSVKNGSVPAQITKSKSSDWTDVDLEVPEKEEAIHLKNPQLTFIFNDNTTPVPPPRKHKKSIREKLETVAKNSMQVLQAKKEEKKVEEPKPVEEELCVKKTINYRCPCEDRENCPHNKPKNTSKKDSKRKKNLSVVSLPNYSDLKLTIANSENCNLRHIDSSKSNSASSLPEETKKETPPGKLEHYMTRCRSFGSLLNNKLRVSKEPANIESDDSFGGLEDWDLGILEHYRPRDASLPRPRKPANDANFLADIENMIVPEEEVTPVRPMRRSESLVKKTNNESSEATRRSSERTTEAHGGSPTPPPSPQPCVEEDFQIVDLPTQDEEGKVEHSSLMRILQEYSVKDAQKRNEDVPQGQIVESEIVNKVQMDTPAFSSHRKERTVSNVTTDFINAEKVCVS